jgi:hypothetical protein
MRVIKSEWHQVERRYATEIDIDFLAEACPDMSDEELNEMMDRLESGEMTLEELEEVAGDAWYEIDWEWLDEDDWWTDRKGGYDVTYEVDNNE